MKRSELIEIIGNTMNSADAEYRQATAAKPHSDGDLADFFLFAYGKVADAVAVKVGIVLEET